jgi:hypothetical protein
MKLNWSPGNNKLGAIVNFSIPAIKTCPGKTKFCSSVCYADKGYFKFHEKIYNNNYEQSKHPDFIKTAIKDLKNIKPKIVRIHVAGDFYDADYIEKWMQIVKACPEIKFYCYTRSWSIPELRNKLEHLRQLPNIHLWYSVDYDNAKFLEQLDE